MSGTPTGVVLAGGRSTRMGRDKATLPWSDTQTMIERVAGVLGAVCARVIVAGATPALPALVHVPDRVADAGPLGGIEAVLASDLDTDYVFWPCDVPRVTADLVRALLVPTTAAVTVLHVAGEQAPRPLPARCRATMLDLVRSRLAEGRRAVHGLLGSVTLEVVDVDESAAALLENVNTPGEYERMRTGSEA